MQGSRPPPPGRGQRASAHRDRRIRADRSAAPNVQGGLRRRLVDGGDLEPPRLRHRHGARSGRERRTVALAARRSGQYAMGRFASRQLRRVTATCGDATSPHDHKSDDRASWARDGTIVTVSTKWLTAMFDEQRGGALVSLTDTSGNEHLAAPSLELVWCGSATGERADRHERLLFSWPRTCAPRSRTPGEPTATNATSTRNRGLAATTRREPFSCLDTPLG